MNCAEEERAVWFCFLLKMRHRVQDKFIQVSNGNPLWPAASTDLEAVSPIKALMPSLPSLQSSIHYFKLSHKVQNILKRSTSVLLDFLIVFNRFTLKFHLQNTYSKKIVLTMMKISVLKMFPSTSKPPFLSYHFKSLTFLLLTQNDSSVF